MTSGTVTQRIGREVYTTTGTHLRPDPYSDRFGKTKLWSTTGYELAFAVFLQVPVEEDHWYHWPIRGSDAFWISLNFHELDMVTPYFGMELIPDDELWSDKNHGIQVGEWFALMISADTNDPDNLICKAWVHKVDGTPVRLWSYPTSKYNYTTDNSSYIRFSSGPSYTSNNFDFSQWYMDSHFIDWDDPAERRKFVDSTGRPRNLGPTAVNLSGFQPRIYAPDGDLTNNLGTESNFTVQYGEISPSTTSPSDGAIARIGLRQEATGMHWTSGGPATQSLFSLGQTASVLTVANLDFGPIFQELADAPYAISSAIKYVPTTQGDRGYELVDPVPSHTSTSFSFAAFLKRPTTTVWNPATFYMVVGNNTNFTIRSDYSAVRISITIPDPYDSYSWYDDFTAGSWSRTPPEDRLRDYVLEGEWYALLISVDASGTGPVTIQALVQPMGSKVVTELEPVNVDINPLPDGPYSFGWDGTFHVGMVQSYSGAITGLVTGYYLTDEFIDWTNFNKRRKFVSEWGYPVDIGADGSGLTGTQPIIYAPDGDLTNNVGSAANFSTWEYAPVVYTTDSPSDNARRLIKLGQTATVETKPAFTASATQRLFYAPDVFTVGGKQLLSKYSSPVGQGYQGDTSTNGNDYYITIAGFFRIPTTLGGYRMVVADPKTVYLNDLFFFLWNNWIAGHNGFKLEYMSTTIDLANAESVHGINVGDWFAFMFSLDYSQSGDPTIEIWMQEVGTTSAVDVLPYCTVDVGYQGPRSRDFACETVGGDGYGDYTWGGGDFELSTFYVTNEFVDWSDSAERLKFIDANGYPVDQGSTGSNLTGTQPLLYFPDGDGTNNLGSKGNYTAFGTPIADSSTSPSDGVSGSESTVQQIMLAYLTDNQGPIEQTLPAVTQALEGESIITPIYGDIVQVLSAVTQAATTIYWGGANFGTTTQAMQLISQSAVGKYRPGRFTGAIIQDFPIASQALDATFRTLHTGSVTQELSSIYQALAGTFEPEATGPITQSLFSIDQSLSGNLTYRTVISLWYRQSMKPVAQTLTATKYVLADGSQSLWGIAQTLSGTYDPGAYEGAINQPLFFVGQELTGSKVRVGELTANLFSPSQALTGTYGPGISLAESTLRLFSSAQTLTGTSGLGVRLAVITQTLPAVNQQTRLKYYVVAEAVGLVWKPEEIDFVWESTDDGLLWEE